MREGSASAADAAACALEGRDGLTPMMSACLAAKVSIRRPPPAAGDEDGRTTRPVGSGGAVECGHPIVLPGEVERSLGEQAPEHGDVLDQPVDADLGRIHDDARAGVVVDLVTGAETDLEPSLRELIDRRQLAGQHGRMTEVCGEDGCRDAQRGGRGGRCGHGGDRAVALVEVVRREQRRVAERLELPRRIGPCRALEGSHHLDAEAERSWGHRRWWTFCSPYTGVGIPTARALSCSARYSE